MPDQSSKSKPAKSASRPATQTVTAGDTKVQVSDTSGGRRGRRPKVTIMVGQGEAVRHVSDFVSFVREHAVVGLAVGFVIGTQVQAVVKQLISSFIDPLFALLLNGQKLSSMQTTLHFHGRAQAFGWGAFVYTLLDFMFVILVIYVVIRLFKLDKLDKTKA